MATNLLLTPSRTRLFLVLFLGVFTFQGLLAQIGPRNMEYLNRGLVAVEATDYVFLSWRTLVTDSVGVEFNLYRDGNMLNATPITDVSNYVDSTGTTESIYYLETVLAGSDTSISTPVTVWRDGYHSIPTQTPAGYTISDASTADLDGDGELEFVVEMVGSSRDNSQSGVTDPVELHAYRMNGELLWSINLGINIRAGEHYTQLMVYDLNSDGKAEVAVKTAPGTTDGLGNFLSKGPAANDDDAADYRNSGGYILSGPEYLTVFEGTTGKEISTVYYIPSRHPDTENPTSGQLNSIWGDGYGNRVDRFLAAVAYFDETPSLVMCRGYYTRTALTAYDFDGDSLVVRWMFDTYGDATLNAYRGQGAHSLSVGDADGDGKDEIMYGAMAVDDDGSPMYSTLYNHGDATHYSDLVPSNPGLEFYMPSETAGWVHDGVTNPAIHVRASGTGTILWEIPGEGDIGRAMTADLTPDYPGYEFWSAGGFGPYSSDGQLISGPRPSMNFGIWWDGDLSRELLDDTHIDKWYATGTQRIFDAIGTTSNNGTKAVPSLSGDVLGDWREEVILPAADERSLRIYTTVDPTEYGFFTLLQDPQYRLALTWQNVAYNQPPHPGFFLGNGMTEQPAVAMAFTAPQPSVSIQNPTNGVELNLGEDLNVTIQATALADTNESVILILDGTAIDTVEGAPYYALVTGLTPGPHMLEASAFGSDGQAIQSAPVMFDVDFGFPKITLTSPVGGTNFTGTDLIPYAADANDYNGEIDSVIFYLDDVAIATDTAAPYEFMLDNPGLGIYEAKAHAYDNDGNATWSDSVEFNVGIPTIVQENETGWCGFMGGSGTIDSNHAGYTGSGFANTENVLGSGLDYAVEIAEAGEYLMEWRYASTSSRSADIVMDDTVVLASVAFEATGDWTIWERDGAVVNLPTGLHKITLESTNSNGLNNIDYMNIMSLEAATPAAAGDCENLVNSIGDVEEAQPIIYPNPTSRTLYVQFPYTGDPIDQVAVYQMNGQLLMLDKDLATYNARLDLPELANGIYVIRVQSNSRVYTQRFQVVTP